MICGGYVIQLNLEKKKKSDQKPYYPKQVPKVDTRSRIHERTVSFRFLGITLGVLRLEVFLYNVQNSFKPLLLGGGGVK